MEDTRPLQGMARSIDALFSDAERQQEPAETDEAAAKDDAVEPTAESGDPTETARPDAVGAAAAPADSPEVPDDAGEARVASADSTEAHPSVTGEASAASADSTEARPPVNGDASPASGSARASLASADLLDDVELIPPRVDEERASVGPPLSLDEVENEDPAALAEAASWPTGGEDPPRPGRSGASDAPAVGADVSGASDAPATGVDVSGASDAPPAVPDLHPVGPRSVEAAAAAPDDVALRARALAVAVGAYMEAEPRRREAAADRVREAVAAHREARELDAVSDAVERLSRAGDASAVALARELAIPAVASHLVGRLGMARDDERRGELFEMAERLGGVMAPAVADALSGADDRSARRNFVEALVRLGEPGLRQAEAMLEDSRWFVVRNAVAILGDVGGPRAVEHLTSTLAHEDPRVRRETLMGLARIGGDDAGMLVAGKLEDPDPEVRAAAAMAVGALRVERAQRSLQALLEGEDDPNVLVQTLVALGQLGDPGAVVAIEKKAVGSFFSRPPTPVRLAAYRALAAIGTPRARTLIEAAAAEDRDPEVKQLTRALLDAR
ncbi:MAG: HEAT repeat domain-containing protein [Gemmatimonadetes bacterium]|nr:HEAT repeat domain-containing protein [Gemmatimonadota bacterium]